ncbi:sulfurtransferase TusA family protein [Alphaproteobacteria bacterium]|nr:sulfurtransferase TusA family protein [Alphaproteobacteria bacterium]
MIIDLDYRGLKCPLPVLRLRKALKNKQSSKQYRVLTSDHNSVKDIKTFCKISGGEIISLEEKDSVFCFLINFNKE